MSKRRSYCYGERATVARSAFETLMQRLETAAASTKAEFSAFVEFEEGRLGRPLDVEERLRALALVEATAPRR
jgi:hypothetical protein